MAIPWGVKSRYVETDGKPRPQGGRMSSHQNTGQKDADITDWASDHSGVYGR